MDDTDIIWLSFQSTDSGQVNQGSARSGRVVVEVGSGRFVGIGRVSGQVQFAGHRHADLRPLLGQAQQSQRPRRARDTAIPRIARRSVFLGERGRGDFRQSNTLVDGGERSWRGLAADLGQRPIRGSSRLPVERTSHTKSRCLRDMGINLRRFHARMSQQLLHRSDIRARFQEVRCKAVPQHMRTDSFVKFIDCVNHPVLRSITFKNGRIGPLPTTQEKVRTRPTKP